VEDKCKTEEKYRALINSIFSTKRMEFDFT